MAGGLLGANIEKLNIEDSPASVLEMPAQITIYEVSGWNQKWSKSCPHSLEMAPRLLLVNLSRA